ncbi:hypothetical protein BGZ96_001464 [Linnemannia gamsii]|uniref:Uncharacterized protein n=1 Tax=Linnemannia gamsii TaxID=64522 RepID=A0ABQ7JM78_9FUNG|nr:hypothetical protein BGZ96_001464 [Linnemannia gamsii]
MKFTTPTKFLLLVATIALVANAQAGPGNPVRPDAPGLPGETTTGTGGATTPPTKPTTTVPSIPVITTTPKPTVTTAPPIITTPPPVLTTTNSPLPPPVSTTTSTIPTFTPPTTPKSCVTTADCQVNEYCGFSNETANLPQATGYCLAMVSRMPMCNASPVQACVGHADCRIKGFGYCFEQKCAGTGIPGTALECREGSLVGGGDQNTPGKDDSKGSLTKTLTYAGIGIGSVAFLGLVFAVVRWRSNKKKRSRKMPDFADVDYGMSTTAARSKSQRQQRQSEPRSSLGGNGGEGQAYPFSNRPAMMAGAAAAGAGGAMAAGAVAANDQDYYNEQYYDDGYAQHSKSGYDNGYGDQSGGGYDNYGYGQGGYDQGYDQQGYDQQGYYKEAGGAVGGAVGGYEGYDQHGNYIGDQNGGYYDQQGYDYSQQQQDYQYPATSGAGASGAIVAGAGAMDGSGVAYPAEVAAVSPRRNGGVEMMPEQDFGNSASGAGYGRNY